MAVRVSVRDMPEVLAEMRAELARLLVSEAGAEVSPAVAKRLREVAAGFEAGVSRVDMRQKKRPKGERDAG